MGIICFLKDTLGEKLLFFKIIWTVQKRAIYLHMCWESDYHCDFMLLDSVCSNRSDATFCVKLIYRQYQAQSWSVDKFGVMGCSFEWVMDINRDIGFFCNQSSTRGHNKFRKMWEIYPKMKKRSKKVERCNPKLVAKKVDVTVYVHGVLVWMGHGYKSWHLQFLQAILNQRIQEISENVRNIPYKEKNDPKKLKV